MNKAPVAEAVGGSIKLLHLSNVVVSPAITFFGRGSAEFGATKKLFNFIGHVV
jgi:hypothetical protein